MAKLDTALWRNMMDYLRHRHAPICRQWFEDLSPVALDGGLLQIQTSTAVQQNYLQKKCLTQFTEAAQQATGQLVAVRFVDEAPAPGKRATPSGNGSSTPTAASDNNGAGRAAGMVSNSFPASRSDDDDDGEIVLIPDNSFENFVVGPNNQLAHAAATAVASRPGTAYNPIFIHGGVGLGKTHLLHAICQQLINERPGVRILYVSCDAFMNQFIEFVQASRMKEFRHRYRHVDVLVIDDIHFLGSKDRSQEEFFHTFNDLHLSNRQIVLSSDAPPSEIPNLEERLVSRFQCGLVAHVSKPGYETRIAILKAKARLRGMEMPDEAYAYIAGKLDTNARELEGAINNLHLLANGKEGDSPRSIDLKLAHEALGDPDLVPRANQVTLQNIIDVVTAYYNVKLSDLQSRRRHKSVTEPRQACMWLARKRTRFSLEEIGGYFGGRDHTTVMHSIRTIDERSLKDTSFARQMDMLDDQIQRATDSGDAT